MKLPTRWYLRPISIAILKKRGDKNHSTQPTCITIYVYKQRIEVSVAFLYALSIHNFFHLCIIPINIV